MDCLTGNHKVLVKDVNGRMEWKCVDKLREGDSVVNYDGVEGQSVSVVCAYSGNSWFDKLKARIRNMFEL